MLSKIQNLLPELNFPPYTFRIRREKNALQIYDDIRKSWVKLSPEEWVRQHLIRFLVEERNFPKSLLSIEKQVILNNTQKRPDIVAYNSDGKAIFIAECKAPGVKIQQQAFDQAQRYHLVLGVKSIVLSNGNSHYSVCWNQIKNIMEPQQDIPDYKTLTK